MQTMQETEEQQQYGISRILSFSDGVFGFAITLLIVNVIGAFPPSPLPQSPTNEQIWKALLGLWSSFFTYALSFYMVGIYWVVHHRMFRSIIKYNTTLLWLNLTMLLFVVLLPFSTALLDKYSHNSVIVAFYAATLAMISLCSMILWEYAAFHDRLLPPDLDQKTLTYFRARGVITLGLYIISIGFAFLNPSLAVAILVAIFFVRPLLLRQFASASHWYLLWLPNGENEGKREE
jgi:uncharacterized membrane protein